MTWGFFTYVIFFNPGQAFVFYAWLQQWPAALLAQHVASTHRIAQLLADVWRARQKRSQHFRDAVAKRRRDTLGELQELRALYR